MKRRILDVARASIALVWAAALAGCGKPAVTEDAAMGEVRGEPIQAAVVEAPPAQPITAATEEVSASVAASPATRSSSEVSAPQADAPALTERHPSRGTPDQPLEVAFEKLASFQYDLPDGPIGTNAVSEAQAPSAQIPEPIKALNNQFVSLKGFMLPLKVEKGLVTELLIMRDQSMCCYGTVPRINEWVSVKMVGGGVKPVMDQAVTLFGTLKVGEMYENGYLVGIYAMNGERLAGPLDM